MATFLQSVWQRWNGRDKPEPQVKRMLNTNRPHLSAPPPLDIKPGDPLIAFFLKAPGAVEIDTLHLDSPALQTLKAAGVQLAIPLVSQDELVGLLNLGPRQSSETASVGLWIE
jgi:hypothetical protein